jgi:hypothetical protein
LFFSLIHLLAISGLALYGIPVGDHLNNLYAQLS